MIAYLNGVKLGREWPEVDEKVQLVCFVSHGEKGPWPQAVPQLDVLSLAECRGGRGTRFESREGFDYLSIEAVDTADPDAVPKQMQLVFTGRRLVADTGGHPAGAQVLAELEAHAGELAPERVLYLLFVHLTEADAAALDDMEEEVAQLEEQLVAGNTPEGCAARINGLRHRLLKLKRYYEALFDLLEDLEENVNGFISPGQLRSFHVQTNRADRLNRAVLNLRDYVTQVREAYQNQLDIRLNETMKLFTVITAVFLPLTLLTGWYGMNLAIPEYNWPWAYPAFIVASVVVAGLCLAYFKRKKWF